MKITKQQLQDFLNERPAISNRKLSIEAKMHPNTIDQLFNGCNRNLTQRISDNLMVVIGRYGFDLRL